MKVATPLTANAVKGVFGCAPAAQAREIWVTIWLRKKDIKKLKKSVDISFPVWYYTTTKDKGDKK